MEVGLVADDVIGLQGIRMDPGRLPELLYLSIQPIARLLDSGLVHHNAPRSLFTDESAGTIPKELSLHEADE